MEEEGLRLTEEEWMRLQVQVQRENSCQGSYVLLRSRSQPDTMRLQSLRCGTRRCVGCGTLARQYARRRIRVSQLYHYGVEWRQFWTLTVPRDAAASALDAWKLIGDKLSRCLRIYHRWLKDKLPHGFRVHYAWVLEEQADGWPHVHMVSNVEYPDGREACLRLVRVLRHLWNKHWSVQYSIVQLEKPRSGEGSSDYLTPYVAKMDGWPAPLHAVMYRKRGWASTLPMLPTMVKPPPEWQVEYVVSIREATAIVGDWVREGYLIRRDWRGQVEASPAPVQVWELPRIEWTYGPELPPDPGPDPG